MEKVSPELSRLDAISMGKPVHNDVSMNLATIVLRWFAGRATDIQGDTSLNTAGMVNMTFRQPYGVCGAIIPWNGPILMLVVKIAPALIAGNTVVLKTSEKAPLSALVIGRLCQEIGLPSGVLNILSGYGRPAGEAIAKHMRIRKVSFTGSAATGRAIKQAAAGSNLKNVTLELGGKSPLVVFDDADLDAAVPVAAASITDNSGQSCVASSRVYVHKSIAETFITKMKDAMTKISTNTSTDPLEEGILRGPQADKLQFDRVMEFLQYARKSKLNIAMGGSRDGNTGYFVQPTIITDAPETSRVMQEEIFGPVVCINTFTDEKEVMKRANDTEYGLYASVFTKDISRALRMAKKFEAGMVAINTTSPATALDMPFGGWKASGDGRDLSKHAIDHWTELKTVLVKL